MIKLFDRCFFTKEEDDIPFEECKEIDVTKEVLVQCKNIRPFKTLWVKGYTTLPINEYNKDDIKFDITIQVEELLAKHQVGYIIDDSNGCYLCCDTKDYKDLCRQFQCEFDEELDKKEYYYATLFNDIMISFSEECDVKDNATDLDIYKVIRHILINLEDYAHYFRNARPYDSFNPEQHWVNQMWTEAYRAVKK